MTVPTASAFEWDAFISVGEVPSQFGPVSDKLNDDDTAGMTADPLCGGSRG